MSSGYLFNSCLHDGLSGRINFEADRFAVMLLTDGYKPDVRHARRSDLTDEVVGQGYRSGGLRVSVAIVAADEGGVEISLGGQRWTDATIGARFAAYYKDNRGDPSDDELVALIDFERNVISTSGTWVLSESTLGIGNG